MLSFSGTKTKGSMTHEKAAKLVELRMKKDMQSFSHKAAKREGGKCRGGAHDIA